MNSKHSTSCSLAGNTSLFTLGQNMLLFGLFLVGQLTLSAQSISFSKTNLLGTNLSEPTSLDFGPDGRLYVSERTGSIYAYTVDKVGNNYQVMATETILLVKNIVNHNDDGTLFVYFDGINRRQITGLTVVGTPENPVLYVSSSDERIGGGGGSDTNLDTNSGVVSRLTYDDSTWTKVDLIRGLPRSEENHATNGLQYVAATNKLYLAQGGNTNAGAPSANFDHLCEYALATAILEVDLNLIDAMPVLTDPISGQQYIYDLPTLDDPTRTNIGNEDINDPFGGNDGLNQAKYIPGGPIYIYSTGYRNQYDLVITELGNMYTWDNGPNAGIGGHPENEGAANVTNNWVTGEPGSITPGPNDGPVNNKDGLHKVTDGYYAGHPNPIRANPSGAGLFTHEAGPSETGTFRTTITGNPATTLPVDWPPYPDSLKDVREADYQNPGVSDGSIYVREASTNGMTEYTATTFGGALQGDLLAVSFSGEVLRVDLDANGDLGPNGVTSIANQLGIPLDVTTLPNNSFFAGTIWVAEFSGNSIAVLDPANNNTCLGTDDNTIDEDNDGYTNSDEIQNGSDPCNPAITPPDFDQTLIGGFKVSNLNDPDDDDDGLLDTTDPFAQDAFNGLNTTLPIFNRLANGTSGLLDLGFTGLMTNNTTDYLDLIFNENDIIAGGAPELLVIPGVPENIALGNQNDEVNAFQFGINVDSNTPSFRVTGKIVPPFLGTPPTNNQQHGIYIGSGDQDNYIKILLVANNGVGGVQVVHETNGVVNTENYPFNTILNAASNKLSLSVNPATGEVQPLLSVNGSNTFPLGSGPLTTSGSLLNAIQNPNMALAVGITASSSGANDSFTAIWDDIRILFNDPNALIGQWQTINDGQNCTPKGSPGSCPIGRHETSYVEVGDKFYMLGGRETNVVDIYDPITDIWTEGAAAPITMNHFQAIEYQGLIYVIGAFTGDYPNETPVPNIYIYDPTMDEWTVGPVIPVARQRGAGGVAVYKGKIYLAGGVTNGHIDGRVAWLDEYDPTTNIWTSLVDAPNERDHFHAEIWDDKLYLIAGKRTGMGGNTHATQPIVDVYDFINESWQSLPNSIPTPRGGNSIALLGNEILVIGGENSLGTSLNKTEALNLENGTWRILPNLQEGRHGTQAIVNNGVVYVAAGSPNIGGGWSQSQEVFFFTQKNVPVLNPIAQSVLVPEGENLNTLNTLQFTEDNASIVLKNTVGNQGIIIEAINLVIGSSPTFSFSLPNNATLPLVLAAGDSLMININTTSATPADENGLLIITHSGANAPMTSIILNNPICVDADMDGFCESEDCDDNNFMLPAAPGTPCDDGNPNSDNDMILADGCTCQGVGGGIVDCNGVTFTGGNGEITLGNLLAASEIVEIIGVGTNYNVVEVCNGDCADTEIIPNLAAGAYTVKVNMLGSDNSYCYREESVIVTEGPCTDVDEDGVCANVDCDDNDPAIPTVPGTSCNDGDSNTMDDVILADGCTCQGTIMCPADADGDGFCVTEDCDDNNPAIPTAPGTSCNDGNPNTTGDVIQADGCTCAGNTGGGTANCETLQITGGVGQITIENLTAASEIVELIGAPSNWQIIPVCNSDCDDTEIVTGLNPGSYTVKINMFGDDNTYCYTEINVIVTEGCIDNDDDGICVPEDCDDNNANFPMLVGTSCDDGDVNTTNDVIQANGCDCAGVLSCAIDADNDGVCFPEDCDDNDPFLPTIPGSICDDGNPNTTGDVYLADGCTCQGNEGGDTVDCANVEFIGGNGIITLTGLTAAAEEIEIIGAGTNWIPTLICAAADPCENPYIIMDLTPGLYTVKLQMFGDDNTYCFRQQDVLVTDGPCIDEDNDGVCADVDCDDNDPFLPTIPGSICDDGNPNTTGDIYLADGCTCQGTLPCVTDADNDGVCASEDCDDNDANFPMPVGTACNDNNPNTIGDVIQSDGCTCAGSMGGTANCDNVQFTGGAGIITLTNLTAASEIVEIIGVNTNWLVEVKCDMDCSDPFVIPGLIAGTYTVKLQMFGDDNTYCFRQEDVVVTTPNLAPTTLSRTNQFLAFSANLTEQAVNMNWLNNTAYKNDRFIIERSADGEYFESIFEQKEIGELSEINNYHELDESPLDGDNFYRLKLIYEDGSFIYTEVQKVKFNRLPDFGMYPNPAKEEVFIDVSSYVGKAAYISIKDHLGKELYHQYTPKLTATQYRISLQNFDNGLYFVQIKTDEKTLITKKLLVTKLY